MALAEVRKQCRGYAPSGKHLEILERDKAVILIRTQQGKDRPVTVSLKDYAPWEALLMRDRISFCRFMYAPGTQGYELNFVACDPNPIGLENPNHVSSSLIFVSGKRVRLLSLNLVRMCVRKVVGYWELLHHLHTHRAVAIDDIVNLTAVPQRVANDFRQAQNFIKVWYTILCDGKLQNEANKVLEAAEQVAALLPIEETDDTVGSKEEATENNRVLTAAAEKLSSRLEEFIAKLTFCVTLDTLPLCNWTLQEFDVTPETLNAAISAQLDREWFNDSAAADCRRVALQADGQRMIKLVKHLPWLRQLQIDVETLTFASHWFRVMLEGKITVNRGLHSSFGQKAFCDLDPFMPHTDDIKRAPHLTVLFTPWKKGAHTAEPMILHCFVRDATPIEKEKSLATRIADRDVVLTGFTTLSPERRQPASLKVSKQGAVAETGCERVTVGDIAPRWWQHFEAVIDSATERLGLTPRATLSDAIAQAGTGTALSCALADTVHINQITDSLSLAAIKETLVSEHRRLLRMRLAETEQRTNYSDFIVFQLRVSSWVDNIERALNLSPDGALIDRAAAVQRCVRVNPHFAIGYERMVRFEMGLTKDRPTRCCTAAAECQGPACVYVHLTDK